ncbi:hypothetical protein H257_11479 [Aphanomyces astaci]|uniref:Tetraspanin n=1 Tax=Aphanomyces astaci TaxID=112090 RepID=W4G4A7_APHAT|nr:hypothetical protein H257_11479 [Aphanomyces astaci]ETV73788.1 hypothetical protein H257_11479 [Aphanomyces astaci]|eukprot:XP_009836724.1 hypothetical protein H257_11479 [Aphanomyces astaci]
MAAVAVTECTIALLLFGIGAGLSDSTKFHMALGSQVHSVGGGFVFLSLLYPVVAGIGFIGAKYHNKFLLLVHMGGLVALAVMQTSIATSGLVLASPDYSYAFQDACLTNNFLNNQTQRELCQPFFLSDTFGGLRLAWQTFYVESLADQTAGAGMQKLQDANVCCGLGPPRHCQNDTRPFPSSRPSTDWPTQQVCPTTTKNSGDYMPTPLCYAGGSCSFDYPIGSCGMSGAGLFAKGCASALHRNMASTLQGLCITVQALLFFTVLFGCSTMCLMFKRKDEDVLPSGTQISIRPKETKVYCSREIAQLEKDF